MKVLLDTSLTALACPIRIGYDAQIFRSRRLSMPIADLSQLKLAFDRFHRKCPKKGKRAAALDAQRVDAQLNEILSRTDESALRLQLIEFLSARWTLIKGGQFAYPCNPDSPATRICWAVACYLAATDPQHRKAYQYLIPSITCTYNSLMPDEDLDSLQLGECILADDGCSLIPVQILSYLSDETPLTRPFLSPEAARPCRITPGEWQRLRRFNPHVSKLYELSRQVQQLKQDGASHGHQLQQLVIALRKGGVSQGTGTRQAAGQAAYEGINQFFAYFNQLDVEEKRDLRRLPIPATHFNLGQVLDTLAGKKTPICDCVEENADHIEALLANQTDLFANAPLLLRTQGKLKQYQENLAANARGQDSPGPCEYDVDLQFQATGNRDFIAFTRGLIASGRSQSEIIARLGQIRGENGTVLPKPEDPAWQDLLAEIINKDFNQLFHRIKCLFTQTINAQRIELLHQAIRENRRWLVRALVAHDPRCLAGRRDGLSPMQVAAGMNPVDWDIVRVLAEAIDAIEPQPASDDFNMGYLLWRASQHNKRKLIALCLQQTNLSFSWHQNSGELIGFTALHFAIRNEDTQSIRKIVGQSKQHHTAFKQQVSAFGYAVAQRNFTALDAMVEQDKGTVRYTAYINQAIRAKDTEMVMYLVNKSPASLFVSDTEQLPLTLAANSDQWALVARLMAVIQTYQDKSQLASLDLGRLLMSATRARQFELADQCVLLGASLTWFSNKQQSIGFTAIHFLIQAQEYRRLARCLRHGAKLHIAYATGPSSFAYAVSQGDQRALALLIRYDQERPDYSPYIQQALDMNNKALVLQLAEAQPSALVSRAAGRSVMERLIETADWTLFASLSQQLLSQPFAVKSKLATGMILMQLVKAGRQADAILWLQNFPLQVVCNPAPGQEQGFTALHYALDQPEVLDQLLKAGASPFQGQAPALSAFDYAIAQGKVAAVQRILKQPATAALLQRGLQVAVHFRNRACIDCFLAAGVDSKAVLVTLNDLGDTEARDWILNYQPSSQLESEDDLSDCTSLDEDASQASSASLTG